MSFLHKNSQESPYAMIGELNSNHVPNDPVAYTALSNPYISSYEFGPMREESKLYMAQRCATKWDKYCEMYASHPEVGEEHKRRTYKEKYCTPTQCAVYFEQLDPTQHESAMIKKEFGTCKYHCREPDPNDPVAQRLKSKWPRD